MDEIKEPPKGWVCPTCSTVWSPEVKSCPKCTVKEDQTTKDTRKFLTEG